MTQRQVTIKFSAEELAAVMRGLARELGPPVVRSAAEHDLVVRIVMAWKRFGPDGRVVRKTSSVVLS